MPNFRVFTDQASDLKTRVYGYTGSADQPMLVDASGAVGIYAPTAIDVTATDLDIRNLTADSDNILIYGQDSTPAKHVLLTDTYGNVQIMNYRRLLTDTYETVGTVTTYTGSTARDTGEQSEYTFSIKNSGENGATVKLQLSPNNSDWIDDSAESTVASGALISMAASKFVRYARISYKSQTAGSDTTLVVYFQAHV